MRIHHVRILMIQDFVNALLRPFNILLYSLTFLNDLSIGFSRMFQKHPSHLCMPYTLLLITIALRYLAIKFNPNGIGVHLLTVIAESA